MTWPSDKAIIEGADGLAEMVDLTELTTTEVIDQIRNLQASIKAQLDGQIANPMCPCCLTATVGIDGNVGYSSEAYEDGRETPIHWWKASCVTCRSTIERRWTDGELQTNLTESPHGTAIRELREARTELEKWTSHTRWQHLRAFLGW